jgi:hypothetical protein
VDERSLKASLEERQRRGQIAEISMTKGMFQVRPVGRTEWLEDLIAQAPDKITGVPANQQNYYFLSHQLRPGSGIIRAFGGKPEGPGGTLTCFLSSLDGRSRYFAGAGHVLSNFWYDEDVEGARSDGSPTASIYRYQKGFPATKSTRFLGKLTHLSPKPKTIKYYPTDDREDDDREKPVDLDIGIVDFLGDVEPVQRTTCYGTFGEWPSRPDQKVQEGQVVMKCGAEEPHWTYAVVENPRAKVTVYGPAVVGNSHSPSGSRLKGQLYELRGQVILSLSHDVQRPDSTDPPPPDPCRPSRSFKGPFAVPGDSGTMVVDEKTKQPVGMLIAGSVLDGRYVMTPIKPLWDFWTGEGLVLTRG